MTRALTHIEPDMRLSRTEREADRAAMLAERAAVESLHEIEAELREQASGSQDGYLLDVADRIRDALKHL
jgi:hypothetical protein